MKTIRIGNGAGYAGDRIEPAMELIEKGNLDYIIFECLAERTVAIGQQDKEKDSEKGYNQLLEISHEKDITFVVPQSCKDDYKHGGGKPKGGCKTDQKKLQRS